MYKSNKSKSLHCKEFKPFIEQAIKNLENGENRFIVSDYSIEDIFREHYFDFSKLLDDCDETSSDKDIEDIKNDFFEEIKLLEKIIIDIINKGDPINIVSYHLAPEIQKQTARRSYAVKLWKFYGIPLRHKNGKVYIIHAPQMYPPGISEIPIDNLLSDLFRIPIYKKDKQRNKAWEQLSLWQKIVFIAIVFMVLLFFLIFG